ncbi:MAG: saccharopine dehydrogenase [Bacteroidetes bacterium]|nr:saccharopine dehydrogenase [Bacteroidota bacterium]
MKKILLIGAGRSTLFLIEYIEQHAAAENWELTVADRDQHMIDAHVKSDKTRKTLLDISDSHHLEKLVSDHDLVVSMLPAHMHMSVARYCLQYKKHLCTASYLTDEMKALDPEVKKAGLVFLNEMGLDPGLDHLSAMKLLDKLREGGNHILEFESFTGGLIAPESEDNPWKYKFTWNPRNVVLAGQGGAVKFIQNGMYKFIPYHKLFRRTEIIEIDKYGKFEGYANRDSLKYRETYGLQDVQTMYRGTLRRPGFCRAWDLFVQLGATDDSYVLPDSENMTHRDFINTFLAYNIHDSVEIKLRQYLKIDQDDVDLWEKLEWLDVFTHEKVGLKDATPAQVLEHILKKKWSLKTEDKDMIVMWHKVVFEDQHKNTVHINSSTVVKGEPGERTAMAKTVGLPLALGCRMILEEKVKQTGTILPITKDIYTPVLAELEKFNIRFTETITS